MPPLSSDRPDHPKQPESYEDYNNEIDLVAYIQVLLKRKKFITVTTLCFILAGLFSVWFNKTYEAQTLVLLSLKVEQKDNAGLSSGTLGIESVMPTLSASTYEVLATTSDLSRSLFDSLKVAQEDTSVTISPYGLTARLIPQSGSSPTQLMTLSVTSPDRDVPVEVVNTWTRLFVERNRGLSSGVAISYHDWVENQYKIAEKNLTQTERALQDLDSKHHNLNILENEVSIKNAEMDAALKSYQSLDVSFESRIQERDYLQNLLSGLEINGEWIGYLSLDQISPSAVAASEAIPTRKVLLLLVREILKLEQDSTAISQKHEDRLQAYNAEAKNKLESFSRDKSIHSVRKHAEYLTQSLDIFRAELPGLEGRVKRVNIELDVYRQNLTKEEPTIRLAKAITDDALWDQVSSKGRVAKGAQKDLSRYKLRTETVNPIYQQIAKKVTDLRIASELYMRRIDFLKNEIPVLQLELITVLDFLDSLEVKEQKLNHELSDSKFLIDKQKEIETMWIFSKLQRRRQAFEDHRAFYFARKQQLETLVREIQRMQADINFEQSRFTNWRDEIQALSAATDSLQITRTQLQRNLVVYQETFQRFSRLLEEARISLEQAAGDLQVISWASEVGAKSNVKHFFIIVMGGGLIAIFLAFVIEYIEKAQARFKHMNE